MGTIYFHIGTPKTGTSAIQDFCSANRSLLQKKGICFPDLGFRFEGIGMNRNGHFLVQKLYKEGKVRDYEAEQKLRSQGMEKLLSLCAKYETVILSDEQFWNNKEWDAGRWSEYRGLFQKQGTDLKLIVYLRRQDQLIQSYWAQQVKETMTMSFEKYVTSGKFQYFQLDYAKRLQILAEGVGKENVIVRVYEKGQYQGSQKNILSDFMQLLSIVLDDTYQYSTMPVNPSLSGKFLEVKRILNQNPVFQEKKSFLVPLLVQLQMEEEKSTGRQRIRYFTSEQQHAFLENYEEGNRLVAREYLLREEEVLFYESDGAAGEEATKYSNRELVTLCGKVIALQEQLRLQQAKNSQKPVQAAKAVLKGFLRRKP